MGIFIRTLIVTLIICAGYYTWIYFAKEGYSPELKISKEAKNVLVQEKPGVKDDGATGGQTQSQSKTLKDIRVAFLTNEGTIRYVTRKAPHKTLYTALSLLMKGPTEDEGNFGIFTEIPKDARLISVKENKEENSIIINLTKEFGEGGGTQSIQARLEQIVQTAKLYTGTADVYLYLDGSKAQYLGGEGIYIDQPINRSF